MNSLPVLTPACSRATSSRAFTLIELLVVILIIAILIAVALPSFLGETNKAQISKIEQQEYTSYEAAKAATVNGQSDTFDQGTRLVGEITRAEPELSSVLSASNSASAAAGDGHVYVGDTTSGGFEAVGITPSGTAVILAAPANGGVSYSTASTSTSSSTGGSGGTPTAWPDDLVGSDTISIYAGNGSSNGSSDTGLGGSPAQASLPRPYDVATDPAGDVFTVDSTAETVLEIPATSGIHNGVAMTAGDIYQIGSFSAGIQNVAADGNGDVFVDSTSPSAPTVSEITSSGAVMTLVGPGQNGTGTGNLGPAANAQVAGYPTGLGADAQGDVFLSDAAGFVYEIPASSGTQYGIAMTAGNMYSIAGGGATSDIGYTGPATGASMNQPYGDIAVGSDGSLYVADAYNNIVVKISPSGTMTTVAGNGTSGYSGDNGPATAAEVNDPVGVAVTPDGTLYISDCNNGVVREVSQSGTMFTLAGNGTYANTSFPSPANQAGNIGPEGVALSTATGQLFIADPWDHRITAVAP